MSFLNPLFLLGLAAVAAPIIVHLVRRTKAPRVEFPSLMFVRRVPQRTIRRRMIRNWLLLAMRCLAFLLLAPGGALFTYSCSGGISADLFHKIVAGAGLDAGVDGIVYARTAAAPDHPMTVTFPEGEYLKGLVILKQ